MQFWSTFTLINHNKVSRFKNSVSFRLHILNLPFLSEVCEHPVWPPFVSSRSAVVVSCGCLLKPVICRGDRSKWRMFLFELNHICRGRAPWDCGDGSWYACSFTEWTSSSVAYVLKGQPGSYRLSQCWTFENMRPLKCFAVKMETY